MKVKAQDCRNEMHMSESKTKIKHGSRNLAKKMRPGERLKVARWINLVRNVLLLDRFRQATVYLYCTMFVKSVEMLLIYAPLIV